MDELSPDHQSLVSEFTSIIGETPGNDEVTPKIIQLLSSNGWDLNISLLKYFDNGFDSLSSAPIEEANPFTSSSEVYEDNAFNLSHRNNRNVATNLQTQMFLDDLIPRLPKAPKISNHWSLELGIHSSLKEQKTETESELTLEQPATKKPSINFWIILLIIPKAIITMLISIYKFLFGNLNILKNSPLLGINKFPSSFDYDRYDENYNFIGYFLEKLLRTYQKSIEISDEDESKSQADSYTNDIHLKFEEFNLIFEGFNDIHQKVQNDYQWLLVILVNDSIECEQFVENLFLKNKNFNKLFNKTNGVYKDSYIYVNNIDKHPETHEIGKTYKVKRIPYVMLIGNITNNKSIMSSMSILYKSNISHQFLSNTEIINGTNNKITRNLNKLLDDFNPQLITKQIDKQEIEISRMLKEQQDSAYLKSLETDKLKKINENFLIQKQQNLEKLVKIRENFLFGLIKTRWFEELNEDLKGDGLTTKIAIKLPNGKRIIEMISKNISILQIYYFVELKLFINDLINRDQDEFNNEDDVLSYINAQPQDTTVETIDFDEYVSKFPFKFELIQPFPKKVIGASSNLVKETPELKSGANLLVEYVEDSEDESDA